MSTCISHREGVRARKPYRCVLCGEAIIVSELHDTRTGVQSGDGFWTMRMHTECHRYELVPDIVDWEWYEDMSEPAFERAAAIEHAKK